MSNLLDGVTATSVPTGRLSVNVLSVRESGEPVLFVHGNISSSLFWQQTMLALPATYRPLAVDLRGFGDTEPLPVDATRGVRDYADDVVSLLDSLSLSSVHLVGWSMGGGVVMQLLRDRPSIARTVTLVAPVSPYGYGGTVGAEGALIDPAGACAGGGAGNPDFVAALRDGDRSADSPLSPRAVLRSFYVKPPFQPEHEDIYVESMLSTRIGDDHYPGDSVPSPVWPGLAAGGRGVLNTMAPNHFRLDDLPDITPKPPIRWIRGDADQIVSDASMCAGRGPRVAGQRNPPAAADAGPDPRGTRPLRRSGRHLRRDRLRRHRPQPTPREAGRVLRRTPGDPRQGLAEFFPS
jgi:pimeloyl-ACP methyl ester carboxylesterase